MPRRIDIELTSARDDGTWTWRAAGALKPRGVLDAKLLYPGANAGDVVRAEADFEIEGITILAVLPPKAKRAEPERLEIIGTPREQGGVTSSLVSKQDRPRDRDRDRDRTRDRGPGAPRGGPGGERQSRDPQAARSGAPTRGSGPPRDRDAGRPLRSTGAPAAPEGPPRGRPGPPRGGERGDEARRGDRQSSDRPARDRPAPDRPAAAPKPKPKRLNPSNTYRAAVLDNLPVDQRPIAEQVLRGGIPAVRQAVESENERARAEGKPEASAEALLMLAEGLLPRLKAAEWRDRAEAAFKAVDEIGLRDLRAVVAGADAVARDDEARTLASQLREALERRVTAELDEWVAAVNSALEEGRVVRALRLSAHPPDPTTRFPAELAVRLADAASAAMTPETMADRWLTLLEAVAASPVRRSVKPVGLPAEPGDALLQAAKQASGRVPALAALLGIDMPPPPGPRRATKPGAGARPTRSARSAPRPGAPRIPPPPPSATRPSSEPAAAAPAPAASPEPAAETAAGVAPLTSPAAAVVADLEPAAAPYPIVIAPATDEMVAADDVALPTDPPIGVPDSPAEAVAQETLAESEHHTP